MAENQGFISSDVDATSPALHFLGRTQSRSDLDEQSYAMSTFLAELGVVRGDRVLLQLQNMPQAVIACMAVWRLGAVLVPVNPMYKCVEFGHIAADCRPSAAIVLDSLYAAVALPVWSELGHVPTITTSPVEYADPDVAAEMSLESIECTGTELFSEIVSRAASGGHPFDRAECGPDDLAALVYTSGTTGPPKGALITHRNLTVERDLWAQAYGFEPADVMMGIAPCFHITGLVADLVVALDCRVPLVQTYRFDPVSALRWIEHYEPTSMVAAITVYTALLNSPGLSADRVRSIRTPLSGGASVSPATVKWWRDTTGQYIRNCYGLTETSSLVTLTPQGREAPVDETSGALSVGCATSGTTMRICDDAGDEVPNGTVGEVVVQGPQVVQGYWEKAQESASAFTPFGLRTGDVGFVDDDGWLYLVDRSKDLIVSSGFKIWPREVEDTLMLHPAVREAAVIGVPDDYRGEDVAAFVTFKSGESADESEIIDFCRDRLAVFKAPRKITILSDLPKTASGKILRRALRT